MTWRVCDARRVSTPGSQRRVDGNRRASPKSGSLKDRIGMNIEETVRAILLHEWDPLSIRTNRSLAAENDDYMPGVLRLIESKCSAAQLESHLETLEKGWGMIPCGAAGVAARKIVEALDKGSA
jgi:hypothetical protein